MKCFYLLLCVVGLFLSVFISEPAAADDKNFREIVATVVGVDDGDTLIVSADHRAIIVDLADVVCPPIEEKEGVKANGTIGTFYIPYVN